MLLIAAGLEAMVLACLPGLSRSNHGLPYGQETSRLWASRRGIAVAGVPAAYSSIWGAEHWQAPLTSKTQKVSRHTAAAVVLGRRALGHSARRRPQASPGVTAPGQRTEAAGAKENPVSPAGAESYQVGTAVVPWAGHEATRKPYRREGHLARGRKTRSGDVGLWVARPAKTVRAGPLGEDSPTLSA